MPELTDTDRTILEIERLVWVYAGRKEAAVRDRLGVSATRYYQLLNAALDRPEVEAADPLTVRRLRRIRDRRLAQRRVS